MVHIPVLQKEVLQYLEPKPNENFIDCTIGKGGHALAILEKNGPNGKVLGIDQDQELIQSLKTRAAAKGEEEDLSSSPRKIKHFEERLILVCDNFANLEEIVKKQNFKKISGILFDLGMSSWHLEESGRGFSFLRDEPLDMRYDLRNPLTAEKIINFWSEPDIEKILREFGEENFSEKIAKTIIKERKFGSIKTTFQLVKIIKKAVPLRYQHPERQRRGKMSEAHRPPDRQRRGKMSEAHRPQRLHCATRTFQAIRIAVNKELDNLRKALPQAVEILRIEGKLLVISFHSLEDRIVKNFFREKARENILKIITKKPVKPSKEEIKINARSRSGKLRTAVKICPK